MNQYKLFFFSVFFINASISGAQNVTIHENSNQVTLANELLSVTFNKIKGEITGIKYDRRSNILGDKGSGYLMGPNFGMNPSKFRVLRKTPKLIEIAFDHYSDKTYLRYTLHYILSSEVSGIYSYLTVRHKASDLPGNYGQTRWGLRADEKYFDYHLVRDTIQGPMPSKSDLEDGDKIQDWTFTLPDGTVYTKYNYADYIEGRHVHGMAGQKSGLGLFVIQASHEYLNGGPTKQYQNVHSGPFLINMFKCGHFLSDVRIPEGPISGDWVKLHGPFLLYVNKGKSINEIWTDAKKQSQKEIVQWPYKWVDDPEYPLQRASVKGNIELKSGKKFAQATVVLSPPEVDWQIQQRSYMFTTKTDDKGDFELKNVREGNYSLYAFGDNILDEFVKKDIVIKGTALIDLGKQVWQPASNGNLLWQLGRADRRTTGFKLSDKNRQYGLFELVPADITFVMGKSKEGEDWYYAQTKRGTWNIEFDNQKKLSGNSTLTLGIAGAARWPKVQVMVNDKVIGTLDNLGNDASVYRSAMAGGFYQQKQLVFPADLLKTGKNTVSLTLTKVNPKGGVMYDAIKLESY